MIGLACAAASYGAETRLSVAGAHVTIILDPDAFIIREAEIIDWVRRSAEIVGAYYGGFPVKTLTVRVLPISGSEVGGGQAFPSEEPLVRVEVGREISAQSLLSDWVLPHEMTHLALPEVGSEHRWLSEGLATYVEGVARVQSGNMTEIELWTEYVHAMPKGLPLVDDHGLDRTHTWGRTYWGGATFCLVADVTIRQRTGNRLGLQDALRVIARTSGGMTVAWTIDRVFHEGDAATRTHVLTELYEAMRVEPTAPDLDVLWHRLGVATAGDTVVLGSDAPDAAIRAAIVRRAAGDETSSPRMEHIRPGRLSYRRPLTTTKG